MDPVPAVRFPNGLEVLLARVPPSFSFFLKMFENIFLKLPEDVGKRGLRSPLLSNVDSRGDVLGEKVLEVNEERGRAEKMEETELEEEWPWPELDRGECGSERASEGGRRPEDFPPNVTGEDSGRGIVLWPDGGRGRAAGDLCNASIR